MCLSLMREKSQVSYYIEYCGRIKPSENGKQKIFISPLSKMLNCLIGCTAVYKYLL